MSLYKIPLIALLALEFRAMLTPPHAAPAKDEVVKTTVVDLPGTRKYRLAFIRGGQMAFAAIEILIIAALAFPSSSISQKVLSVLVLPGGNPDRVQISTLSIVGAALWITGARIRMWTYRELGRFFHFEISIQKNHVLITSGPYAYVRHPSYTGMILASLGWFLWTFAPGSWMRECGILRSYIGIMVLAVYIIIGLLPVLAVTLGRMSKEDEALRQKFGSQWEAWHQRVPYAVIPGLY